MLGGRVNRGELSPLGVRERCAALLLEDAPKLGALNGYLVELVKLNLSFYAGGHAYAARCAQNEFQASAREADHSSDVVVLLVLLFLSLGLLGCAVLQLGGLLATHGARAFLLA